MMNTLSLVICIFFLLASSPGFFARPSDNYIAHHLAVVAGVTSNTKPASASSDTGLLDWVVNVVDKAIQTDEKKPSTSTSIGNLTSAVLDIFQKTLDNVDTTSLANVIADAILSSKNSSIETYLTCSNASPWCFGTTFYLLKKNKPESEAKSIGSTQWTCVHKKTAHFKHTLEFMEPRSHPYYLTVSVQHNCTESDRILRISTDLGEPNNEFLNNQDLKNIGRRVETED